MLPALLAALGAVTSAAGAAADDADVRVEVEQFGIGNAYRPGALTALRLILTSSLDDPTPCWVQWEVPNAEGDIAEYGRSITLSPGTRSPVWLYAPLSPHTTDDTIWTVRVFEERDGDRRRELGGRRISPATSGSTRVPLEAGMIAVVGRARARLDDYSNTWNTRSSPPGAHEETRIISGVAPRAMPDRWQGLAPFEAVVWTDALPQQLRVDSAGALREYVRRGGHLVIILPEAGNPWVLGARGQTSLDDLLVQQAPRKDDLMLSELMPVLSKSRLGPIRDFELTVRVFSEIGGAYTSIDNRYEPLIALPDGRVVVIQRLVDFGRITIVGIDLASQRLASMRLPQADVFWNRILGRRADTPQPQELLAMESNDPRMLTRGGANEVFIGDRQVLRNDVDKSREASAGLLAAVLLFGAYWAIAGPGLFFFLKQHGRVRHSWLVFAATGGLFTAVAWGGVRLLRQSDTEFLHVTFLDHVVRPGDAGLDSEPHFQRAVSWGALYLPGYGDVGVSIDSDPVQRGQDLLYTWEAPPPRQPERFPNVDRYLVDVARSPANYRVPARATATQLYLNWMGALDPDWGGTLRVDPDDPITVTGGPGTSARFTGTLINDLPGILSNVRVIWVGNTRMKRREYLWEDNELPWVPRTRSGEMLNVGHIWASDAGRAPWYPGTRLSLAEFLVPSGRTFLQRNIHDTYIAPHESDRFDAFGMSGSGAQLKPGEVRKYIEMLSIYHQLGPPTYITEDKKDPDTAVVIRRLGRELDLSAWFTRPCLIVIGYLENSSTPVPLTVDGEIPHSRGLTVVRWIYPLPLDDAKIIASSVGGSRPDRSADRSR